MHTYTLVPLKFRLELGPSELDANTELDVVIDTPRTSLGYQGGSKIRQICSHGAQRAHLRHTVAYMNIRIQKIEMSMRREQRNTYHECSLSRVGYHSPPT